MFFCKTFTAVLMSCCDFWTGFVMDSHLSRHTYGFIQSRLVPFYLHLGSACAFFNLTIYAVYHPSDMLNERESFQVCGVFHILTVHLTCMCGHTTMCPLSPPDLHLLCVGDGCGSQRPMVRPNDIRDHGRHARH